MKTGFKLSHSSYWCCFFFCIIFCYTCVWHLAEGNEQKSTITPNISSANDMIDVPSNQSEIDNETVSTDMSVVGTTLLNITQTSVETTVATKSKDTTAATTRTQPTSAESLTTETTTPAPPTLPTATPKLITHNPQLTSSDQPVKPTPTKPPSVKSTTAEQQPVETDGNVKPTSGNNDDHSEPTTKSISDHGTDWFNNIAHNSLVSMLALPIILGVIAAFFIICVAFGVRSCRKKPSRRHGKAMHNGRDHELGGNFDRMKLLADSSEDEF